MKLWLLVCLPLCGKSDVSFGVLAPRGWHCLGNYGSDGDGMQVSPDRIEGQMTGDGIVIRHYSGHGSGGYGVAAVIATVFPAYRSIVSRYVRYDPD